MKRLTFQTFQPYLRCGKRRQFHDSVPLPLLLSLACVVNLGSTRGNVGWCYIECARWETLNNVGRERPRKANPSQLVGHQEVRLPTSLGSGKVQLHSIRQIREMGLGEKKKIRG